MTDPTVNLETRSNILASVLAKTTEKRAVKNAIQAARGDLPAALEQLKGRLPAPSLKKIVFAHSLAEWFDDNAPIVLHLVEQDHISSLRDVALHYEAEELAAFANAESLPATIAGATPDDKVRVLTNSLSKKLFVSETSAVLQRMANKGEFAFADANLRDGVVGFFDKQPNFNIRSTSIYTALRQPEALAHVAEAQRPTVIEQLKNLQRVQAISPVAAAVPALLNANITSASRAAEIPESTFLRIFGGALGEDVAQQVHTNAVNSQIRNEHALAAMRQAVRGTGLAIIDGAQTREDRLGKLQRVTDSQGIPLNLSTLFGSMDFCECDDCLSVYSPAAYFVELLQFLRNNDLDPKNANTGRKGIAGTPVEKLFRRRPDLGCLELTCANTFTVLPYIDLVNEVMESFVVHISDYDKSSPYPATRQARLETFNVEDETTGELLAIPQHVNYYAYCILKGAVYPFTLPYHQPIDATRIFLKYLGTSRWELLDTFRTPTESCPGSTLTTSQLEDLRTLHQAVIDRAVDAEFLGMTQEEYIILTHEAFWPKAYFELTQGKAFSGAEYEINIGVKDVWVYYGYKPGSPGRDAMLSLDESPAPTGQVGLTFVKKQLLPRTGLQYADLVELLKARFINPNFPEGQALTILESLRVSYRFMQTLVDGTIADKKKRYAPLIDFLNKWQALVPLLEAYLHPDPCKENATGWRIESQDFADWVYCYFERIGQLIVLESGEGPELIVSVSSRWAPNLPHLTLPLEGTIVDVQSGVALGVIHPSGEIVRSDGRTWAHVNVDLTVTDTNGQPVTGPLGIEASVNGVEMGVAFIKEGRLSGIDPYTAVAWTAVRDTCDLDKVRLVHLDGSPLSLDEYDRIQRFIRLWRKIGWTIDETDKVLTGLNADSVSTSVAGGGTPKVGMIPPEPAPCEYVGFDVFQDDCTSGGPIGDTSAPGGGSTGVGCPDIVKLDYTITPAFLHQVRAVSLLLAQTGLALPRLLALWSDISTKGDKSLYTQLFLTHNLVSIDPVFKADANGSYLTQPAAITGHIPVLMAALKLSADDISAIMGFAGIPDSLTLTNVSILYRYNLLAKILRVRVALLKDVVDLFGNPFKSAWDTVGLLAIWGKMTDAGFTFRQLDYLLQDRDDNLRPLAPSKKNILQLSKTLYDGLNAIDANNPDITQMQDATSDLIRSKVALLFEPAVVEQILGLLEGTTLYLTNAPAGLSMPKTLPAKLKYSIQKDAVPQTATLQCTGILTGAETTLAGSLFSSEPDWGKAIDRLGKQTQNILNDVLFGIFTNVADARANLLVGDFNDPNDAQNAANTAPQKRFYFIKKFLPFLREQLSQRLITDTTSGAASLAADVTQLLLSDILVVGTPSVSAMAALEAIKTRPSGLPSGWSGYLIPAVDANFVFSAIGDTQPADLQLDGQQIAFTVQQEDPSNVWSTDSSNPVNLKSGRLYRLEVSDRPAEQLQWKTSRSPRAAIPASALLPDYTSSGTEEIFKKLYKAALVINGFELSADEVSYLQRHSVDFDGVDFNLITLTHWKRIEAYADLRNSLPRTDTSLLDLFKWAGAPDDPTKLSEKIAAATTWKKTSVDQLIAPDAADAQSNFDLNRPEVFRNEIGLIKLREAIAVAGKIAVDIDRLFTWAKPGSKFWACHQIAEDIRNALRARFSEDDWEQIVKPLNDDLREHQKKALTDYLLVQQDLIDWGVTDADGLFEFFLIDVQMDACMETSRIKQAISSVQLFIQRCLLGLEERLVAGVEVGVRNDQIDRPRWDWMQRFRVWEANKRVFVHPENFTLEELRDDKTLFFKELESELLQKDINSQTVQDALLGYLFKSDEVANLKVAGLFLDQGQNRIHIFARTRNAPYSFYYRYFDRLEKNWYPWEKVQIDIPSYDEESGSQVTINGSYVIPVVWNNRVLVFFPQFMKKTTPNADVAQRTIADIGNNSTPDGTKPTEFWEIKLGWSEYRNQKWTQKQVSADAVYSFDGTTPFSGQVDHYNFVPRLITGADPKVVIEVSFSGGTPFGQFVFAGSQVYKDTKKPSNLSVGVTEFQVTKGGATIHSYQAADAAAPALMKVEPYFTLGDTNVVAHIDGATVNVSHPFAHELLGKVASGGMDDLFSYLLTDVADTGTAYGASLNDEGKPSFNELKSPYSVYNWEAGFHAPMVLVDRLVKAQQFEQALKICHYVLSPFAAGDPNDSKRFWQFWPFRQIDAENTLQSLFLSLKPGQPNSNINEWRDKPFQPHVVARGRPAAYMMWVAMTYIRTLIAWGDYLFRQDTIETINQATQLYVLAAHVYGPRGQKIPKRGNVLPETYNSLLDKWDAFGNAMVELELAFPFSNQIPSLIGASNGVVGLANVFGFATALYFCIPDNPDLLALRDTIDDRLFKIRHCENIEGVFRQLPLFEPPIDPALLVQAAAQGLSLSSVLNDLNSPMPNYRFYYLLQKALEVCGELKTLGNAFLAAKEKGDSEALSRLRATHDSGIQALVMEVRKLQLDESQKALDALDQGRLGPVYRLQHHLKLIGQDLSKVPDENSDFAELADAIEPPIDESGLKLVSFEKQEMDKASDAKDWQIGIGIVETLASILHVVPSAVLEAKPFGIGTSSTIVSGWMLGNAAQSVARGLQIGANILSHESSNAGRKASFLRQLQDRVQQANVAGYEIKSIDKQRLTQKIRISISQQEITNQQKLMDNAQAVEEFLTSKYTNQELYGWMDTQIRSLYYQAYTLAYDLAKRAEKVFRFERGLAGTNNFIQFGYWQPAYDGLLAGERLYVGLKQLEAAYQEKRGYDFEIAKNVSLQQLNPLALIQLRETGKCEFSLPEVLFDMGFPGHYMRRIKSLSVTLACHVGPPTSINCTLRLLEHKFRTSAQATGKNDYPEQTDSEDDRFSTMNVPIDAVALSTGQNDSGTFELNFRDERYLPFEGAGVISKWVMELPAAFREFDYESIAEVAMTIRYTSIYGGDKFRDIAADSLQAYVKSVENLSRDEGLFAYFDLRHDFPDAWYKAMNPPAGATERILDLKTLLDRLPIFTKGTLPNKIIASDVYLFTDATLIASTISLVQGSTPNAFADSVPAGAMKGFVANTINSPMTAWQIAIGDVTTSVGQLWMVVRYTLQ